VIQGQTGLLVRPGDDTGLAVALERQLTENGIAMEMGRIGRASVFPRLSIDRLEEDIRALYLELVHRTTANQQLVAAGDRL
jgi:glycosyltransferase involved in cell wall biosynthesis